MITMWDFNFIDGKRCDQFFFARGFESLRMVGSYHMPTRINLRIHLLVVINEYETSNVLGANTLRGGQLRQFIDMCIKNTLAKCVAFNFGFQF
jgi:hypothetical protein